jgi:hypothetical protein
MKIELLASKDHPLGGFRLWRREDGKFRAEVMDDPDTLTQDPKWDLQNWLDGLPETDEAIASTGYWGNAEDIYPIHYRNSDASHASWNVCNHLQEFLPGVYAGMDS